MYDKQEWKDEIPDLSRPILDGTGKQKVDPQTGRPLWELVQEGTRITSSRLNHMEDGIQAAHDSIENISQSLTPESIGAAKKSDFDNHVQDNTKHVTAAERNDWNSKAAGSHKHDAADIGSGTMSIARLPSASTSGVGIVQLSDAVNSSATNVAATANAVKRAYDEAVAAKTSGVDKKQKLVDALNAKGIPASTNEDWDVLIAKLSQVEKVSVQEIKEWFFRSEGNEQVARTLFTVPPWTKRFVYTTGNTYPFSKSSIYSGEQANPGAAFIRLIDKNGTVCNIDYFNFSSSGHRRMNIATIIYDFENNLKGMANTYDRSEDAPTNTHGINQYYMPSGVALDRSGNIRLEIFFVTNYAPAEAYISGIVTYY